MAVASYNTTIKAGGTPTTMTDEDMSVVTGNQYQIDDATKQILDRDTDVTVKVDGTTVDNSNYSIDYLFGMVTFTSSQTGDVTISGKFIPTTAVGGASQYGLNISSDILDKTDFETTGFRSKDYGLSDVSVTLERFDDLAKTFKDKILNREGLMIEITPGGGSEKIRGWYVPESANNAGDVSSLETEALTFNLNGNIKSAFSWR